MTNIDKLRKRIIPHLAEVIENEEIELAKIRRLRTGFYVSGMFLVMISLMESWETPWPIRLITVTGIVGGILVGLGMHYDNSINQWPILKPFIDTEKLKKAAEEFKS